VSQLSGSTTRARDIPETWNGGASSEMPAGVSAPPARPAGADLCRCQGACSPGSDGAKAWRTAATARRPATGNRFGEDVRHRVEGTAPGALRREHCAGSTAPGALPTPSAPGNGLSYRPDRRRGEPQTLRHLRKRNTAGPPELAPRSAGRSRTTDAAAAPNRSVAPNTGGMNPFHVIYKEKTRGLLRPFTRLLARSHGLAPTPPRV